MADSPLKDTEGSLLPLTETGQLTEPFLLAGRRTYTLGRDPQCDVVLPFPWVSRRHALIQQEENGRYSILDLGSANGTQVNGQRAVVPTRLANGDRILVGKTELLFRQEGEPETRGLTALEDERTVAFVERDTVTVLICDIHDYTPLAERLGVDATARLLQAWSRRAAEIIRKEGGVVDKFLGDAVMAFWTGSGNISGSVLGALKSAIQIAAMSRKLPETIKELDRPVEIGAALNTGEAMLGNIGPGGKREFTVIGDAVNIAFRLEEQTRVGVLDCILGMETARYLRDLSPHFRRCTFQIKGKQQPVSAWGTSFPKLAAYLKSCER